jgi:integrase
VRRSCGQHLTPCRFGRANPCRRIFEDQTLLRLPAEDRSTTQIALWIWLALDNGITSNQGVDFLVGFAGALRRSELAAMRFEHLHWGKRGLSIQIPRSKTDQEGAGRAVEMAWGVNPRTCPLLALENWLRAAGIKSGSVFRRVSQYGTIGQGMHPDSIGRRVKQLVGKAKLAHAPEYGGHSLRAGFVTEASANGATNDQIMKQTGHTTDAMVRRYARGDREDRLAAESKLGL